MDLSLITMDRQEARERFLEYRRAVRERHSDEDARIMRGYRELARGNQLIQLAQTVKAGGHMELRRGQVTELAPRLAIARASAQWCWLTTRANGSVVFHEERRYNVNARVNVRYLPADTIPRMNWPQITNAGYKALVPPVPPALRPAHKLENYHVLWEAEWQAEPPVDPALLKHIGGDLYVVLATWDLTSIERAVLFERFRTASA